MLQYRSVPTAGFAENVLVITEKYGCEFSCSGCLYSKKKNTVCERNFIPVNLHEDTGALNTLCLHMSLSHVIVYK